MGSLPLDSIVKGDTLKIAREHNAGWILCEAYVKKYPDSKREININNSCMFTYTYQKLLWIFQSRILSLEFKVLIF